MRQKALAIAALVAVLGLLSAFRGHAQDPRAAVGTVFIDARDGGRTVTVSQRGVVVAYLAFRRGSVLSAVDGARRPTHLGDGRFEFHGDFELRALTPDDVRAMSPSRGMPAVEMMSHAPMVFSAHGVDVLLEKTPE